MPTVEVVVLTLEVVSVHTSNDVPASPEASLLITFSECLNYAGAHRHAATTGVSVHSTEPICWSSQLEFLIASAGCKKKRGGGGSLR